MSSLQIRKATKSKSKLRIGLAGTSGSGKTYSALLLASGLTDWSKICVIDTENGSADLYDSLGGYNVITLTSPFTPERYIEAIKAAENAGMEVIIVDSITHEWDGEGGCLDSHTKLGGKFQDWAKVTPRHNSFVQAILQSKCHVITTVRRKQDYAMIQEGGKAKVEKQGLKEVTRDGFEYELTLSFSLNQNHLAEASKDRTGIFMNKADFVVNKSTGEILKKWAESGAEPIKVIETVLEADPTDSWKTLVTEEKEGMTITHPVNQEQSGCAECRDTVSINVKSYSKEKYGRILCYPCQKKEVSTKTL